MAAAPDLLKACKAALAAFYCIELKKAIDKAEEGDYGTRQGSRKNHRADVQ
jgi:hypothetical protein